MKAKPIRTFREGAVGVSVWQHEGTNGTYFDFTVSRCYQGKDGAFNYANRFRNSNAEALMRVVAEAVAWIKEQRQATGGAPANPTDDVPELQQEAYE